MKLTDYLTEDDTRVGKTILSQISAIDKWALKSWGAKNFVSRSDGIQFDVRGGKFKGRIIIVLENDMYNVEAGFVRDFGWVPKKFVQRVFAEDLVKTLDEIIG